MQSKTVAGFAETFSAGKSILINALLAAIVLLGSGVSDSFRVVVVDWRSQVV